MKAFLLILFAGMHLWSHAQPGEAFKRSLARVAAEQVHIHLNKPAYVAGETVYFKGYVMSGLYPSTYSSSFFVQLSSDSATLIKKVFPLISGVAVGTFTLPYDLPEGRFYLTAFTNTSIRESEMPAVVAPLFVHNTTSTSQRPVSYTQQPLVSLHLPQPTLVAGLRTQVFVSVLDQYRQPVAASGHVVDAAGKEVLPFSTNAAGAAELAFIPQAGMQYSVRMDERGAKKVVSLPRVASTGAVLNIDREEAAYGITIQASPDFREKVFLLAEHGNTVLMLSPVTLQGGSSKIKLPISGLPSGVIRVILLTEADRVVGERFIFSNNGEALAKSTIAQQKGDGTNEAITLQFADLKEGTTSASLVNAGVALPHFDRQENILNRLLFSSQLKEPFAFAQGLITDLASVDLALVNSILATHKSAKGDYQLLRSSAQERSLVNDSDFIRIEGIAAPVGKKPLPKESSMNVILRTADSSQAMFTVPVAADGAFSLKGLMFSDSISLFYQLNSNKTAEKAVQIRLASHSLRDLDIYAGSQPGWKHSFIPFGPANVADGEKTALGQLQKEYADAFDKNTLSEVVVQSTKSVRSENEAIEKRYASPLFSSSNARTLNFLTDPPPSDWITLGAYLRRIHSQRFMVEDAGVFSFNSLLGKREYAYFVDESKADFRTIKNFTLAELALIKIFQQSFVGAEGSGPAIAIYTRKSSDMKGGQASTPLQMMTVPGYSGSADFPLPVDNASGDKGGLRPELYWNPYLLVDSDNKRLEVSFRNVHKAAKARLVVEGFGSDGRIIYAVKDVALR